jgi:DNA-binding beta-propeller fold protein YncE
VDYGVWRRLKGYGWDWHMGRLQGRVATLAGSGEEGSADGVGAAARFNDPWGLAVRPDGNLLLVDSGNSTIRHVSAAGAVRTLAGAAGQQGSADGVGAAARFFWPAGVALRPDGSLLVSDYWNRTIRSVSAEGVVSTMAGAAGQQGSTDGPAALARFRGLRGLSLGSDGSLYIADSGNHTIRCLSPDGTVRTVAGAAGQEGTTDGLGPAARFKWPSGLAAAPDGRLYVADSENHTIRCISAAGLVSTLAGAAGQVGSTDGQGDAARFISPFSIAVGPDGSLYVADYSSHSIRCISTEGAVSTLAGAAGQQGSVDGRGPAARFTRPAGLAVGPDGSLFVTDCRSVRRIT